MKFLSGQASPIVQDYNHGQSGPSFQLPDFTKPPPGFSMIPGAPGQPPTLRPAPMPLINEADLTPTVPYFELPAGLMAPLVNVSLQCITGLISYSITIWLHLTWLSAMNKLSCCVIALNVACIAYRVVTIRYPHHTIRIAILESRYVSRYLLKISNWTINTGN